MRESEDYLPDMNYYNPGGMMPEDRHIFMNISTTVSILKKILSNIADLT